MSAEKKYIIKQFPKITAPYCIALEKSVGALVYHKKDGVRQYLLMQYPHGHWEFPRGHVEGSETERETMFRETEEETGISAEQLSVHEEFYESMQFSYIARGDERRDRIKNRKCLFIRKKVVFYLCLSYQDTVLLSHEHQHFRWMPLAEALQQLTYENAKRIISEADRFLNQEDIKFTA